MNALYNISVLVLLMSIVSPTVVSADFCPGIRLLATEMVGRYLCFDSISTGAFINEDNQTDVWINFSDSDTPKGSTFPASTFRNAGSWNYIDVSFGGFDRTFLSFIGTFKPASDFEFTIPDPDAGLNNTCLFPFADIEDNLSEPKIICVNVEAVGNPTEITFVANEYDPCVIDSIYVFGSSIESQQSGVTEYSISASCIKDEGLFDFAPAGEDLLQPTPE